MKVKTLFLIVLLTASTSGCGLFTPEYVASTDKARVITNVFMCWGDTAVYDSKTNTLIPMGWVYLGDYKGWTLKKFDWQEYISLVKESRDKDDK